MQENQNQWQWMEAGRIHEDYSPLNGLMENYKRKVLDLISLCKYKVVVFDFDGTLTEFKYNNSALLPCKDDDINRYFEKNNFYDKCNVLKTMQFILGILYPFGADDAYILSVSQPNVKAPKLECIKRYFPEFKEENIYQVANADAKLEVLWQLHEKHRREIVFIEDAAKTLLNAEEKFDFVRGYHISSLIP